MLTLPQQNTGWRIVYPPGGNNNANKTMQNNEKTSNNKCLKQVCIACTMTTVTNEFVNTLQTTEITLTNTEQMCALPRHTGWRTWRKTRKNHSHNRPRKVVYSTPPAFFITKLGRLSELLRFWAGNYLGPS